MDCKESLETILNSLQEQRENYNLEFKESENKLPGDFWETYSSFSNTAGGFIILGVKEKPFRIIGVSNPEEIIKNLFNLASNPQKVSRNVLSNNTVNIHNIDGKNIISVYIPEQPITKKPIYLRENMKQTYIRRNEGDFLATEEELKRFVRNSSVENDNELLSGYTIEDLDINCILEFKNKVSARYPDKNYLEMKNDEFLRRIGVIQIDRNDNRKEKLTLAGLLFLGKYEAIQQRLPYFHLEYLNKRACKDTRWKDRVSFGDIGSDNMNLYNFYIIVLEKLKATVEEPFALDERLVRKSPSDLSTALREALANTLIHADYLDSEVSVKIVVDDYFYSFLNPGTMKISKEQFFLGGVSVPRNNGIIALFRLIGASERVGDGGRTIFDTVEANNFRHPELETDLKSTFLKIWTAAPQNSYPELSDNAVGVLLYIKQKKFVTMNEIIEATELSEYYVRLALKEVMENGFVSMVGRGRATKYQWNPTKLETLVAFDKLSAILKNHR